MARIPRDFHFVFGLKPQEQPFHIAFYLCLESCLRVNQPERMVFHYLYEPFGPWWEKIRPKLVLSQVAAEAFVHGNTVYRQTQEGRFIVDRDLTYAHESDFLRLKLLLDQGGVYADLDTLFLNPLPGELFDRPFVLGAENPVAPSPGVPAEDSLCNAFILSEPGAAFGRQWLENMYRVFDGSWSRHSCIEAGRLGKLMPEELHVCPPHFFYKHPWTRAGIHTMLLGKDFDYSEMYSMHLWAHLWWERERRDFSTFHAGLLTERFIRTVDTTYTVAARRFLD